jgi:hypothetical protein
VVCVCVWFFNIISCNENLNSTHIAFANKFKNTVYAVKNNSCQNLSCLMVNVVVFVSHMCWELHIMWAIVLAVNPYTL